MKKILYLLTVIFYIVTPAVAQEKFQYTIHGILPDTITDGKVYLKPQWPEGPAHAIDSTTITNGQFTFQGISDKKGAIFNIVFESLPVNLAHKGMVISEPGEITYQYTITPDSSKITSATGTPFNDWLSRNIVIPGTQMRIIGQKLQNPETSPEEKQQLMEQIRLFTQPIKKEVPSFIKQNIQYPVGEFFFLSFATSLTDTDRKELIPFLTEPGREKYNEIAKMLPGSPLSAGEDYIPFSGNTPEGTELNITGIIEKNSLTLIDFWASWCVPCIREMPLIKELYDEYAEKGLAIVGVSLDQGEEPWKKALEKHDMPWMQIIDRTQAESEKSIADLYGITTIPATLLIARDGKIIATGLKGKALKEKIKSLLE